VSRISAVRSPFRLFANAEFAAVASVNFARGMTFATIIIALALYADLFAVTGIAAGLFGSAYAAVRLVLVLPLGRFIDIGNSKRYLLAGLAINCVLLLGLLFASSFVHVVLLRVVQGASSIVLIISGVAVVGDICPDSDRGYWIGTYNQVRSLSSLLGDLVGGFLLYRFGFDLTYGVLTLITVVSIASVVFFVRDDPGQSADPDGSTGVEALQILMRRSAIQALVAFRFGFSFGKTAVVLFLPIYARTEFGMSAALIGGILAGGKVIKAVTQGCVGSVTDRIGRHQWFVFAGCLLYAVGTALIPFASHVTALFDPVTVGIRESPFALTPAFFVLFTAWCVIGFADSIRIPTSMAIFVEEGEENNAVAGSLSIRSVSWQVGAIVGPIAVGGMLDFVSFFGAFWIAAAFMFCSGVAFIVLYERGS
jgi:MFS family permease